MLLLLGKVVVQCDLSLGCDAVDTKTPVKLACSRQVGIYVFGQKLDIELGQCGDAMLDSACIRESLFSVLS